jgi:hypothetical protein
MLSQFLKRALPPADAIKNNSQSFEAVALYNLQRSSNAS